MMVSIGVSNRHVHVTKDTYTKLFGESTLNKVRNINQPGQFVSDSFVTLKTDKDIISNVRILGPFRDYNQVEISKTDSFKLGINPPIRDSGDIIDSEKITLVGPLGEVKLEKGCIIANRHIHILPKQLKQYGLEGKQKVKVKLNGEKGGIIDNVFLKVSDDAFFELHLDTDDANAHMVKNGDIGVIL